MPDDQGGSPFEVRRARPEEFERIYDTVDAAFGRKRPRELFDWLYVRNPGGIARCWIVVERETGTILKTGAGFPWPILRGGPASLGDARWGCRRRVLPARIRSQKIPFGETGLNRSATKERQNTLMPDTFTRGQGKILPATQIVGRDRIPIHVGGLRSDEHPRIGSAK